MTKQKNRTASKVAVILMALMMAVAFMPVSAFAAKAAKDVTVMLTVSDRGEIAAAKNGDSMAMKRVVVKDADKNGKITYNEALIAAHDMWFEGGAAAGYATGDPYGYGEMVTKLWGHETTNTLFFTNGEGLETGVMADTVKDGDLLLASINKDQINYADWYTEFDTNMIETDTDTDITLTLKGHLGMAYTPEEKENVVLKNITVGAWIDKDEPFKPIIDEEGQELKTDEDGQVVLNFTEPGFYIITAEGTVPGKSWEGKEIDCPTIAPVCLVEAKYPNTMTIGATKTVKAKATKTTKISAKKAFSVENAVGKVTYKKKSGDKKITVAKDGTVTVKKGLKRGKTYTLKVNVTASGNEEYNSASDVATVKIKIK